MQQITLVYVDASGVEWNMTRAEMVLARLVAKRLAAEIGAGSRRDWHVEGVPTKIARLARVIARETIAPWAEEDIGAN